VTVTGVLTGIIVETGVVILGVYTVVVTVVGSQTMSGVELYDIVTVGVELIVFVIAGVVV
jgi:hypothetical protein